MTLSLIGKVTPSVLSLRCRVRKAEFRYGRVNGAESVAMRPLPGWPLIPVNVSLMIARQREVTSSTTGNNDCGAIGKSFSSYSSVGRGCVPRNRVNRGLRNLSQQRSFTSPCAFSPVSPQREPEPLSVFQQARQKPRSVLCQECKCHRSRYGDRKFLRAPSRHNSGTLPCD